jgi:hypothetical protein
LEFAVCNASIQKFIIKDQRLIVNYYFLLAAFIFYSSSLHRTLAAQKSIKEGEPGSPQIGLFYPATVFHHHKSITYSSK